jgi:hypothetical protein
MLELNDEVGGQRKADDYLARHMQVYNEPDMKADTIMYKWCSLSTGLDQLLQVLGRFDSEAL